MLNYFPSLPKLHAIKHVTNRAVSIDGTCGGLQSISCVNSAFGECCSSDNWCGSNSTYCGLGCQGDYGICYTPISTTPLSTPLTINIEPTITPTILPSNDFTDSKASIISTAVITTVAVSSTVVVSVLIGLLICLCKKSPRLQKRRALQRLGEGNSSNELECQCWKSDDEGKKERADTTSGSEDKELGGKENVRRVEDRVGAGYEGAFRGT